MKSLADLVLLGDVRLYENCEPVQKEELHQVEEWVNDLDNVMKDIREKYGFGRGIAAPQIGIMKRLFYINIDKPLIFINPEIIKKSEEMFDLWDDCMSFPNLLVHVERHREIVVGYRNEKWDYCEIAASGDLSELLQHEYDHLNGVLCIDRAIDQKSFKWRI